MLNCRYGNGKSGMKKLLPPLLFLVCVVVMFLLNLLMPFSQLISFPISLAGLIVVVLGLGLSTAGSRQFKNVGTNIKTFDDPDILVIEGVFRWTRNPMYLGFLLSLVGLAIFLGSLSPVIVVVGFFIITDRWYITFEEKAMARKFGKDYENYKSQTRRWL